jgi:hypothetical protein
MHLRTGDDGPPRSDAMSASHRASGPSPMRSERVREIRQRIADDAYRSADVVDEIARRILRSRDL